MIDFGSDETFIANYKKLKSSRKMGELYHCDKTSVLNHAKKIGYDNSGNSINKITVSDEELYALYLDLGSSEAVSKQFQCSSTAVLNRLKKAGYKLQNKASKLADISKEDFIAAYERLQSAEKVGKFFGCSSTAILNHAKKIGYDTSRKYKLSKDDKQYIIDSYETKTSTELAEQFNVNRGMITKLWHDANLRGKTVQSHSTMIDLTGQTFGYWTVMYPTDERTESGGIKWHCKCKCGIERNVSSLSLRRHQSLSCGSHANISRGNEKVKTILMNANIPFEIEKKFPTCKDIKILPFDFYVNNTYLIEYDGMQHFEESSLFDYEYTHSHDIIKSQWCRDNNIPLIRIPYTRYDDLVLDDLLLESTQFLDVMPTL